MALFVLRKLILQMRMRSHPVGLLDLFFGRTLRLLPYFMCANSEGSGGTAQMRRLARAFAGRLCDKYHNLMSWLIHVLKFSDCSASNSATNNQPCCQANHPSTNHKACCKTNISTNHPQNRSANHPPTNLSTNHTASNYTRWV